MRTTAAGLGSLLLTLVLGNAVSAAEPDPIRTRSRFFDLYYEVNEDALPLDRVELFYTLDQGDTWRSFGLDEDRQPPMSFHAAEEGLYGFFFVFENATNVSTPAPAKSSQPHAWAFVDETPPVVQLHELRLTSSVGLPVLQIRWTAIDTYLLPRPIEVQYQQLPDPTWHPVAAEPLANTGRYDWRIPDELSGGISVRISAADEGGHRVESTCQQIDLTANKVRELRTPRNGSESDSKLQRSPGTGPNDAAPAKAKQRAAQLFAEGIALRDSGLEREAVSRMREVLTHDPRRVDALAEIGQLLHHLGDLDRSLAAYDAALKQEPSLRAALRGSALVLEQKKEYKTACERLQSVVRDDPVDAEAWMKLGDLAVFQGDEILARDYYGRASRVDPKAVKVIADARKRLTLMGDRTAVQRKNGR